MKVLCYLIVYLCLVACSSSGNRDREKLEKIVPLIELKGNWSTNSLSLDGLNEERFILLSLNDDNQCYFTPIGQMCKYEINGDEIKFMIDDLSPYSFKIGLLNDTNLFMIPLDRANEAIYEFVDGSGSMEEKKYEITDTLHFYRIVKQNSLEIKEVLFRSSQCPGLCESIYLRIDSTGNVEYFGGASVEKLGGYSGHIAESTYQNLVDQIHLLDLDDIKSDYPILRTDEQSWDLIITDAFGKEIRTSVNSIGLEPPPLRVLINELHALPKEIEMTKNKEITPFSFIELGRPYLIMVDTE